MEKIDWKDKLAQSFNIDTSKIEEEPVAEEKETENTELPGKQNLKIMLDKRNRKGKAVTIIYDFEGSDEALKVLAKEIKAQCGAGGSARGGEILIQGDVRTKVQEILTKKGYKAKII